MALVLVLYGFGYTTKHGRLVSIKPNESYILVSKTNDHWWHVRKDQNTTPFYVPAQYVREVPSPTQDPDDSANGDSLECLTNTEPVDEANMTKVTAVTPVLIQDGLKETYPFSNFEQTLDNVKTHDPMGDDLLPLATPKTDGLQQVAKPCHVPNLFLHREDQDFPAAPTLPVYYTTPESNISDSDKFSDLSENCTSNTQFMMKQHNLNLAADEMPSSETSPKEQIHGYSEYNNINMVDLYSSVWPSHPATKQGLTLSTTPQVDNESLQSAIYVNVAQLRQSISESPPSAPSSCSPSYFDSEKWEVHVDQESGQEYYYHPTTGQTTWDNPFLDSSTEAEPFPAEEFSSPSPPLSPARRLTTDTATPTWISDWEQLVDETSGQPYFYNPMSGETSWEPPEQLSPYPALMEPMSVHRFHEDLPPPLPEEDYPPEDYPTSDQPELYDELFATGPPTLPREYTLSHVGRTIIPRANLDRSTPPGWNLAVEANGTWVFTNDHSPEQWIKSVDDRGQIYYYVRNGSKSRWNLPELRGHQCMEAPLTPGLSRMENGGEADNVIKNWRHSMGSVPLSSPQDDGRFFPSHRRNTSDYSSDSSSTGNSPETQLNMQNLEKAGILNKTKVSENGKKVRKNWMQTWTVLLGGVLTFHKDPKSAATGSMNKTNHIVPEFAVDLRGATIGWASKEKSSKKNVLELKGKNGVEFLVQYDTESIISDWHKVLTDTIRQLEYQDHQSEEDDRDLYERITHTDPPREDKSGGGVEKRRTSRPSVTHSSNSAADVDQKRVRTKLMKFLMKRPTLQSVKEKGYIRDNVFGCHLAKLCAQERTSCPGFVDKCIKAVEKRGLDIDGLYRVSGNLAVIQKLRFKADHDELDLEDGQWEDVHVITGALKLFFRELPEPLFPFSHFNKFITAIRMPDYNTKLSCFYDLVRSLPPPNHDTMKLLFGHLRRVIQYGEDNRMSVGNVAIVFGPTLLRPEMESSNIAMHMVFQNQIVEFILNEYERIFLSS